MTGPLDRIDWDRAAAASDHFAQGEYLRESVADVFAQLSELGYVVIPAPSVAHKAATVTDASAFRRVASNLDKNYYAGGSNVRAAVSSALRSIAAALDEANR